MVADHGPLGERASPLMAVVMPRIAILPNPKSPPKKKNRKFIFCREPAPTVSMREPLLFLGDLTGKIWQRAA
jgi:hypothetical protein